MRLRNRQEAGRLLAKQLLAYARRPDVIVLALPRGGVPVAFEVAQALQVPLDLCLVVSLLKLEVGIDLALLISQCKIYPKRAFMSYKLEEEVKSNTA